MALGFLGSAFGAEVDITPISGGHQTDRDAFLRALPVDWTLATPKFKMIPAHTMPFP